MRKLLLSLLTLMIFVLCGYAAQNSGDEKKAEKFVKSQGYTVIAQNGEVEKYVLEKSKLYGGTETIPYRQTWSVQAVEPDKYFGKEITTYSFTVKNHPLEKLNKNYNMVKVHIMLSEGNVIGGVSVPVSSEPLRGAAYSFDGKSLEEVTGLSYEQWQDNWKKKYGN